MKNYIGFLIRQKRLELNISQEGLCKGICAPSYLSKIEQGQADASSDIITSLFSALGIRYIGDGSVLAEAREHFDGFFFLLDSEESVKEETNYFFKHREELEHSEFHLDYHLCLLFSHLSAGDQEQAGKEQAYLSRFFPYMEDSQIMRYYLGAAAILGHSENAVQLYLKAAHYGNNSVIHYQLANTLFHIGHYNDCIQRADTAYLFASEEGNPAVLIGASFLLGSCYCNRRDLSIAEKYYKRAIALTRGYRVPVRNYAYYNLGTAYLSCEQYQEAEYYLLQAGELEEESYHNVMLNQKKALLFNQIGNSEKASLYLDRASDALQVLSEDTDKYHLCKKMVTFAEMLKLPDYLDTPGYFELLEDLYENVNLPFGFGFRRFYGLFLIRYYKYQRKYKEALRIREEMDIS